MAETPTRTKEIEVDKLFKNDRKKIFVELGHGGPTTINSKIIKKGLEDGDANYLGIEVDPEAFYQLASIGRDNDWVKSLRLDITDNLNGLEESADEVWLRNLKYVGVNKDIDNRFIKSIYGMVKPGGKFVFVNNYDNFSEALTQEVIEMTEAAGFDVKRVDMEVSDELIIKAYRDDPNIQDLSIAGVNNVGLVATKPL